MARALSLITYSALTSRSDAAVRQRLARLRDTGVISPQSHDERLSTNLPERPAGSFVWLHAASQNALAPTLELYRRLHDFRPDLHGVLTAQCDTSSARNTPQAGLTVCSPPEESANVVKRFLAHWDPDCLIWVGGGFRPALLEAAHVHNVPALSIDAPNNPTTLDVRTNVPGLRNATMSLFDHVITGAPEDVLQWRRAGLDRDRVEALGYLEESATVPLYNEAEFESLCTDIGTRPTWFAANIEAGEVSAVLDAHKQALRRAHRLLLVLSPVNQSVVPEIERACVKLGLHSAMREQDDDLSEAVQVVVVDPQENGLWYRLAPVSFLGQSLTNGGGTDPYPSAVFGSAIVHGPYIGNFENAYARFQTANATRLVRDGRSLGQTINALLAPDKAARMAHAAWDICSMGAEVTDRVTDLVQDILDLREEMRA